MTRSEPDILYDDDFFAWTQDQAAALRRLPQTGLGKQLDVAHVAEEIEDLGKRDLREVTSYIGRLFEHLIKIHAEPASRVVPHWRAEARRFRNSAADAFSSSMRRFIDVDAIWQRSCKRARADLADMGAKAEVSDRSPMTLLDILSDEFDVESALAKIARS